MSQKQQTLFLLMIGLIVVLSAFLVLVPNPDAFPTDTSYLTPITQPTLEAYASDAPITTRLQAVIEAQRHLGKPHFQPNDALYVLYTESISRLTARQKLEQTEIAALQESSGETDEIWLVVFEGDWQVNPPGALASTTPVTFHGCNYVILEMTPNSGVEISGVACGLFK